MNNQKIIIEQAQDKDINQLVDLMNNQYSRKKTSAYFEWQYFQSEYPTILLVAKVGAKLIGMFGLQKRLLNNGAIVGQAIDLLVDKSYRRMGILTQISEKALGFWQDIDLFCAFTNHNGKIACTNKKIAWKVLTKIESLNLVVSGKCLTKAPAKFEYNNLHLTQFIYNNKIRDWRFKSHPDYQYDIIYTSNKDFFAVIKIFQDPTTLEKFGDIVEINCPLEQTEIIAKLVQKSCLYLQNKNISSIVTWALPKTPLYSVLKYYGFTEISQERYLCIKIINHQYEYLHDINEWHLVPADAEIY